MGSGEGGGGIGGGGCGGRGRGREGEVDEGRWGWGSWGGDREIWESEEGLERYWRDVGGRRRMGADREEAEAS